MNYKASFENKICLLTIDCHNHEVYLFQDCADAENFAIMRVAELCPWMVIETIEDVREAEEELGGYLSVWFRDVLLDDVDEYGRFELVDG